MVDEGGGEMSYRLQPLIWNTDMKPSQRFVMLALVDYADDNGQNIYPSIETLSRKTGYSERNVQRILKSLEDEGLILIVGRSKYGTIRITLNLPAIQERKAVEDDTPTDDNLSQINDNLSQINDKMSQINDKMSQSYDKMSPDPLLNPLINPLLDTVNTHTRNENFENAEIADGTFQAEQRNPVIRIYEGVTCYLGIPAGEKGDELRQSILQIYQKKGTVEAAIEYMRPFFQEFRRRYPSHTGIFWATDWAMTGIIPAERKAAAVTQAGRAAPARNGRLEGAALEAAMNAECERLEREAKEKREWQR
jgi:DNA-binding MarR family transcriptional regulator